MLVQNSDNLIRPILSKFNESWGHLNFQNFYANSFIEFIVACVVVINGQFTQKVITGVFVTPGSPFMEIKQSNMVTFTYFHAHECISRRERQMLIMFEFFTQSTI